MHRHITSAQYHRLGHRLGHRLTAAISIAVLSMMAAGSTAYAQDQDAAEGVLEEVIVTGFRKSLEEALNIKRDNVGTVDAIVAEDIADWPDQNLAESLQRIPGITITRDSGEGRNISVRGLSGQYTRVRVNGIEAIAASGGEGGPNRGRDFDFNVFASELFNNLVVHKTAAAELDEGSLGAIVDLNTGRPFNYQEGTTFVVNAQAEYNDLGEDWGPRVTSLFAYHDPDGRWGASASIAYSDTSISELGQNTVRWQTGSFRNVLGVNCSANPSDAGCAEVAGAFHARIPRYGLIQLDRERTGVTAGFQFAPSDRTEISLDILYSELDASRGEKWGEVLFRGNERFMDVASYTYDATRNNVSAMEVDNAWVRTENFLKSWTTDFQQYGLNFDHDFTDDLSMHALVGSSKSELTFPHEITFVYDDRDYNGFFYDYTDDRYPEIIFGGADVTDATNFQLAELRDRPSYVEDGFDVFNLDFAWNFTDSMTLKAGAAYREFTFDTNGTIRDTGVCAAGLYECDTDGDGVDDLYGVPATAAMSEIYYHDDRVGGASTTSWVIPSLDAWIDYFDLFNLPARDDQGNIRSVEEKDTAFWAQLDGDVALGNMTLLYNAGVRYVETDQTSTGYNSGVQVTVDRPKYDDTLPSINLALFITDDLVWRLAWADVMTRPTLGNLSPGGSVDAFNYRVSYQNPFLEPTRATNWDTSLEWYFAEEALVSLALFWKDIESFPIRTERTGTYASTGLPLDLLNPTSPAGQCPECIPWTISELSDGPGADVQGYELAFQMPFDVFTDDGSFLSAFGIIANYTYVDSDVDYTFGSEVVTERLFGLSKHSYNATLYYEIDRFSARIAYAYRDDWLTATSGTGNRFEGYGPTTNVDFSARYSLTDRWDLTFEGLNLTDDYQDRWTDIEARRRYEWDHTGRIYKLGARFNF
jgi:TonB-dependent receptor